MVSIVIPCYNSEYLSDAVVSCNLQNYENIEIIIVDDNPVDRQLTNKPKNTKFIYNKENMGVSYSRNAGIKAAKGEYIITLDADDMLTKDSISGRIRMFEAQPELEVIYGFMLKVHGDISYGDTLRGTWKRHPSEFTAPIYRRSVFEKYGLFHEPLRSKEDKEFSYRLGVHRKSPLKHVVKYKKAEKDVYYYRRHPEAKRKKRATDLMFDIYTCMEFDKRVMQLRREGITPDNTEFLK